MRHGTARLLLRFFLCALLCYLAEPSMLEYSWGMVWHIYAVGVVWDLNTGILKWLLHVLLGQNQLHSFLSGIPRRLSIYEPSRSKLLRSYWRGFTSVTDDSCKVWHEAASWSLWLDELQSSSLVLKNRFFFFFFFAFVSLPTIKNFLFPLPFPSPP